MPPPPRRLSAPAAPGPAAQLAGATAEPSRAVARAAELLRQARAPVFMVAADVAGTRAALRLADRLGGVVDHPDSDALFRNLRVVQDAGGLGTTLSELRNRGDLVVVIGPDPSPAFPRFVERCLAPAQTLFSAAPLRREVVRLGPPAADGAAPWPALSEISCPNERLPEAVAVLAALLRGRTIDERAAPGLDVAALRRLAERLHGASYGVLVWAPSLFAGAGGELMGQALLELARQVTLKTRCSVLALGGGGNLFGVNQVCTWQTGYPVRTAFGSGVPEHDPFRFAGRRMIAEGEADAVVWISAFGAATLPAPLAVPTVLLAPHAPPEASAVAAYIPVGIPGVDHPGQVFRTDGMVAGGAHPTTGRPPPAPPPPRAGRQGPGGGAAPRTPPPCWRASRPGWATRDPPRDDHPTQRRPRRRSRERPGSRQDGSLDRGRTHRRRSRAGREGRSGVRRVRSDRHGRRHRHPQPHRGRQGRPRAPDDGGRPS